MYDWRTGYKHLILLRLYGICYNFAYLFMFCFFGWEACGISVPRPEMEHTQPPAREGKLSTTGSPENFLNTLFLKLLWKLFQNIQMGHKLQKQYSSN